MTKEQRYMHEEIYSKVEPFEGSQPLHLPFSRGYTELMEDFYFDERGVKFTIKKGFVWDGASIPRIAILTGQKMEPDLIKPSLAHDYLYRFGLCSRRTADKIFYDLCRHNGMSVFRAGKMLTALRAFGWPVWIKYKRRGYHD